MILEVRVRRLEEVIDSDHRLIAGRREGERGGSVILRIFLPFSLARRCPEIAMDTEIIRNGTRLAMILAVLSCVLSSVSWMGLERLLRLLLKGSKAGRILDASLR